MVGRIKVGTFTEKPDLPLDRKLPESDESRAAPSELWGWTRSQRIGLGVLLTILLGVLIIYYIRRPARLDDSRILIDGKPLTLPQRVDPNTATAQELFNVCAAHGGKNWDHSSMVKALELMAGFEIGQSSGGAA